jgi:hypothetical protein
MPKYPGVVGVELFSTCVCRLSVPYLSKYADSFKKSYLPTPLLVKTVTMKSATGVQPRHHFDRLSLLLLPLLLLPPPQALGPVPFLEVRGQLREGRVGQYQCGR